MAEFTGERVIPGQVDPDLWNEHRSRYLFAARLCRNKRVLDIGCGSGYGTAELASSATCVVGLDLAADAIEHARQHYSSPAVAFLQGSARALPFPDGAFELVVTFELIEHLAEWHPLLAEARRVLAPGGQFIVSTPNKHFYSESRCSTGHNPFHEHEFEFEEFREALRNLFPHVSMFLQNHGPSIVFQPVEADSGSIVCVEGDPGAPDQSNFFVAVCAASPQTGAPTFVHVPSAANVLRERGQHIALLEEELHTKNEWLEKTKASHQDLVEQFRKLQDELEERNRWAAKLNTEMDEARADIDRLNAELEQLSNNYEAKIAELEKEKEAQTQWAQQTQQQLDEKSQELAHCVDLLHETEKTVEERTTWAQTLDAQLRQLHAELSKIKASRWVKLGHAIGIGPDVRQR